MKPDDIVTMEFRPGPDGWISRPVTFAEFREAWTEARTPHASDPLTTADLATRGRPVGSAEDRLIVVAVLRCKRARAVTGVVLHLSGPDREPLMLAELQQAGADRWLSSESRNGTPRPGGCLAGLDAVPLTSCVLRLRPSVDVDCPDDQGVLHRVPTRALVDAGRTGYEKVRRAYLNRRRPVPQSVDLDQVGSTYSPSTLAAMRDDPYGFGDTTPSGVPDQRAQR